MGTISMQHPSTDLSRRDENVAGNSFRSTMSVPRGATKMMMGSGGLSSDRITTRTFKSGMTDYMEQEFGAEKNYVYKSHKKQLHFVPPKSQSVIPKYKQF
jgi:hypothetical protein